MCTEAQSAPSTLHHVSPFPGPDLNAATLSPQCIATLVLYLVAKFQTSMNQFIDRMEVFASEPVPVDVRLTDCIEGQWGNIVLTTPRALCRYSESVWRPKTKA